MTTSKNVLDRVPLFTSRVRVAENFSKNLSVAESGMLNKKRPAEADLLFSPQIVANGDGGDRAHNGCELRRA